MAKFVVTYILYNSNNPLWLLKIVFVHSQKSPKEAYAALLRRRLTLVQKHNFLQAHRVVVTIVLYNSNLVQNSWPELLTK